MHFEKDNGKIIRMDDFTVDPYVHEVAGKFAAAPAVAEAKS